MSKKVLRLSLIMCVVGLIGLTTLVVSIRKTATASSKSLQNRKITDEAAQRYHMISALSVEDRKVYFGNAPDAVRSELWQAHFVEYLKNHPELNSAQRNVIEDAITFATPELFQMARNSQGKSEVLNSMEIVLKARAQAVFVKGEAKNIFALLGEPIPIQKLTTGAAYPAYCDCNQSHDWCSLGSTSTQCKGWSCWNCGACGCGFMWQYSCDGVC